MSWTRGVSHKHCGIAIYILKVCKSKEELWKLKYLITHAKNNNLQKILLRKKKNQNLSRYYNSITNLKFQHKANNIIFQKSSYKNRPIIIIT